MAPAAMYAEEQKSKPSVFPQMLLTAAAQNTLQHYSNSDGIGTSLVIL